MKIAGLRAFVTVVERGSLAAAARALNISEPALSRQIAALEDEIGLTLFSREQRQLVATREGEAFVSEAQLVLNALERLPEVASGIRDGSRRRLRVITMSRLSLGITAPAIAAFRKAEPDVLVSIDVQPRRALERWIVGQPFDIGIGSLPVQYPGIESEVVFEVPAVAVLPRGHRLATRSHLGAEDLAGEPLIAVARTSLIGQQIEEVFAREGIVAAPATVVSQSRLACQLVALGAGYTITDPIVASTFADKVRCVPIRPTLSLSFGLLFRKSERRNAYAERLAALVRDAADDFLNAGGFADYTG